MTAPIDAALTDGFADARRALLVEFDRADKAIRVLQAALEVLVDVRAACVESLRRLDHHGGLLDLLHRTAALAEAEELMRRMDAGDDLGPVRSFEEVDARLTALAASPVAQSQSGHTRAQRGRRARRACGGDG